MVLSENEYPLHGISIRHVFDGRKNQEAVVLRSLVENGKVNFESKKVPLREALLSRLAIGKGQSPNSPPGSAQLVEGNRLDGIFELRMPIQGNSGGLLFSQVRVILPGGKKSISFKSPILKKEFGRCVTQEIKRELGIND